MQFIDLQSQYKLIKDNVDKSISKVLNHGRYIMGAEVQELEKALSSFVDSRHAIGCANGTDALTLALMAIGIKAGDEVIMPSFTYYATAEAASILGATPIFIDVNKDNFNIDTQLIEDKITKDTKAIIPVSLFGQCSDMDSINNVAKKHNIYVIEDAAQSFGAEYKNKKSCNLSDISCTSFFPSKPLGGYGDGGMCFTNNDELAQKLKSLRIHGQEKKYYHNLIGINSRLDSIQAAILLEKFKIFPEELKKRTTIANSYNEALKDKYSIPLLEKYNNISAYAQYTIKVDNRDEIQQKLKEQNIPTVVYYPVPLPFQTVFQGYRYQESDFPVSLQLSKQVFSLPMSPYLKEEEQQNVINALLNI